MTPSDKPNAQPAASPKTLAVAEKPDADVKEKPKKTSPPSEGATALPHRKSEVTETSRRYITALDQWQVPEKRPELIDAVISDYATMSEPEEALNHSLPYGHPDAPCFTGGKVAGALADLLSASIELSGKTPEQKKTALAMWKSLGEEQHFNLYIGLALLHKQSGNHKKYENMLKILAGGKAGKVHERLKLLEMLKHFNTYPPTIHDHKQLEVMTELAMKTGFPPAIWFLVKTALSPTNSTLLSPTIIPDLISCSDKPDFNSGLVNACVRNFMDVYLVNGTVPANLELNDYQMAQWLFCGIFVFGSRNDVQPKTRKEGFSQVEQLNIHELLKALCISKLAGGATEVHSALTEEKKRVAQMKLLQSLLLLGHQVEKMPPYQQAISFLILGCLAQNGFLKDGNPLLAAEYFALAARYDCFHLLLRDAAQIFMAYGRLEQAAQCLTSLLKHELPPEIHAGVVNQLELCDLLSRSKKTKQIALPQPPKKKSEDSQEDAATPTEPRKQTQSKHRKKRKGPHGKKKSKKKNPHTTHKSHQATDIKKSDVQKTSSSSATASSLEESHHYSSSDEEITEVSEQTPPSPEKMEPSSPKQTLKPTEAATPQVSTVRTKPSKAVRLPEHWAGDNHPAIIRFIDEVNLCRDQYDFSDEKKVIERALHRYQGQAPYGRICEEACWFYLRQQGIRGEPEILQGDQSGSKTHIYQSATNWLNKALSCYLQVLVDKNIKPDELRSLIENHYAAHPEDAANDEFRKRLRSVCASFGHIHEKLAARFYGKGSDDHSIQSHHFYNLKTLADPYYEPELHEAYQPKISVLSESF